MRIAIINPGVRGLASYSLNLYKYLTAAGHDVLLVTESKWKKEDIPIYQAKSYLLLGIAPFVYRPDELLDAIKKFRPDIIHYQWPCGTMDFLFSLILKLHIPVVATIHVSVNSRKFLFDKMWYLYFGIFKRNLLKIAATVPISKFIERQIYARVNIPKEKMHLIYAGVDVTHYKPAKKSNDDLELLFVGQIMPEKGIDVLVDAVIAVNKKRAVNLTIVGDGHYRRMLMNKTKGLPFIKWMGFVKEQKKVIDYYARSDLTVLPTRWDEAFSLVPVESMSCGTPVLSTNKGGTPEIVIPHKTGILIEDCKKELLVDALLSVKKQDLEKMGRIARNFVVKKHSFEIWGKEHEKLYKSLIKKKD
jgi:glycosyltransferase involved in cell wall biosynthesis